MDASFSHAKSSEYLKVGHIVGNFPVDSQSEGCVSSRRLEKKAMFWPRGSVDPITGCDNSTLKQPRQSIVLLHKLLLFINIFLHEFSSSPLCYLSTSDTNSSHHLSEEKEKERILRNRDQYTKHGSYPPVSFSVRSSPPPEHRVLDRP